MMHVQTVACGKCGTATIDTASGRCISCRPVTGPGQAPELQFKDHNAQELVNDLRDIAVKFHATGQLRARISEAVGKFLVDAMGRQAAGERDVARYRWLRDKSEPGICTFYLSVGSAFTGVRFARETVDEAIDAQLSQEKAQ